jgi:ABC transporter with metal-binding/Fe-S-binding domain ATP-binding protein
LFHLSFKEFKNIYDLMDLAVLFSGGKDSTFALHSVLNQGHKIKYLITIFSESKESWMFHHPCIELTKLQAEALGIEQISEKTKGEKEKELEDLKKSLEKVKDKIDGVVSGAVASEYQKSRVDKVCKELGLKSLTPLWNEGSEKLLTEEVKSGFEIIFTAVSSEGLDRDWLGKRIDLESMQELKKLSKKFGFNLVFEGGEAETFVLDAPIFKKKINFTEFEKIWDKKTNSGYLIIKNAKLILK